MFVEHMKIHNCSQSRFVDTQMADIFIMDTWSDLVHQLFRSNDTSPPFVANFSDLEVSVKESLTSVGRLPADVISRVYECLFEYATVICGAQLIIIDFPACLDHRNSMRRRSFSVTTAILGLIERFPMVHYVSIPWVDIKIAHDSYPYHFSECTVSLYRKAFDAALGDSLRGLARNRPNHLGDFIREFA